MSQNLEKINFPAGTVVSEKLARPGMTEFYSILFHFISSQTSPSGSATPVRYSILHRFPIVWKDDYIVQLTHYFTCQYPNCAAAIRVICSVLFAFKFASLCRFRLGSEQLNECLDELLHFL
jgi:hypothetical protein